MIFDGKLVLTNSRKVLIGGLDGNFLLYNQGFTTTLSGEVSFISPIWPHKTYGCNQIHVCKVNTSEILRAVHVHKHQYVV